ncbi:MAG: hypothetical protein WBF35_11060 [Candidatus Acidiferrales bacterium]
MEAWMGWAMIVEGLLLSVVLALTLTWSALRAVFHLMPATSPAPRLARSLPPRRTPARAA